MVGRVIIVLVFFWSLVGHASPEREFIKSCTYGVLAGTLVGAATLAFEDNPGDNLQRVARGASLGLYSGIALGIYTVYYIPDKIEEKQEQELDPDLRLNTDEYSKVKIPKFQIFPQIAQDQTGIGMVYRF